MSAFIIETPVNAVIDVPGHGKLSVITTWDMTDEFPAWTKICHEKGWSHPCCHFCYLRMDHAVSGLCVILWNNIPGFEVVRNRFFIPNIEGLKLTDMEYLFPLARELHRLRGELFKIIVDRKP